MTVEGQLLEIRPNAAICLALHDAATNCFNDYDARVTLTLRSGAQFTGKLERDPSGFVTDARLQNDRNGWVMVDTVEIVAVEAFKIKQGRRY